MRILVAGAAGFIGRRIFEALRDSGTPVCGLARRSEDCGEGMIACDLTQPERVADALREARPDVVVHCAGTPFYQATQTFVEGYLNNVLSTGHLLDAAIKNKVGRFIFLSSIMVYGDSYRIADGDAESANPKNWYSQSKRLCEDMLRDHSGEIEGVVLRLPTVLGRGKKTGDLIMDMIEAFASKRAFTIYGGGSARRQFLDVRDLAEVVRHCAQRAMEDGRFLLAPVVGTPPRTIKEISESVKGIVGSGEVAFDSSRRDSPDQLIDLAIVERLTGCRPRIGLEDSVRELVRRA
ncbi:MAG: NAD(P)-dependent oxidoreductase [Elusimicrobia bacterium]|nr:NAD(P)-dependent oxidoreductase [Elusimicrobiota bacterium]